MHMNLEANDLYSIIRHSSSLASKLLATGQLSHLYLYVTSTSFPWWSRIYFKRFTYIFNTYLWNIQDTYSECS